MHLANFSGRQGGCTLRIRRTNKVGNGERKSIWQGLEGSQIHVVGVQCMSITEDIVPCGLQAVSIVYKHD